MIRNFAMSSKLVIELDEQTTKRYLELAAKRSESEIEADCEPSGASLTIEISPEQYNPSTIWFDGDEIGEASVNIKED